MINGLCRKSADTEDVSDVRGEAQAVENREQVEKGLVVWIVRPALDGDAVRCVPKYTSVVCLVLEQQSQR